MVLSHRRFIALGVVAPLALVVGFAHWAGHPIVLAQAPASVQLTVYSKQSFYTVPMVTMSAQPFVGVVELLEPLGSVEAHVDGKKFKLRFSSPDVREVELQFQDGKEKGKIKGNNVKLSANFVIQNGRGYVPLSSVSEVLARTLSLQIRLNSAARRLFIGDVGQHFTLDLRSGTPSKLFVGFDAPVNPTIATEPGHIRFTFRREPLLAAADHVTFTDPLITGATFTEHDGVGELDITGTSALMANFADGGKTIVVTAAPAPPPVVAQPTPPPVVVAPPQPAATQPAAALPQRSVVLIDPAHGGSEVGAVITADVLEKDVVLVLARKLQRELANRGIAAALLRNSDIGISLDQRAISANATRPVLYIALHAANTGSGVHIYTAMLNEEGLSARDFLPWDRAQAAFVGASAAVAGSLAAELETRKLPNALLTAPLRPLNNIASPAIAVEIAAPGDNVSDLFNAKYQDQVAQAIAAAIAAGRGKSSEVRP